MKVKMFSLEFQYNEHNGGKTQWQLRKKPEKEKLEKK